MMKFKMFITVLAITISAVGYDFFIHSPYKGERLKQATNSYFHTFFLHKDQKVVKIPPLRQSIIDKNNTIAKTIRMYKLRLANGIIHKHKFSLLINQLSKIIPINKYVIYYYSSEHTNKIKLPFKTIAYGISKANIPKIKAILKNSFHLYRNNYHFIISGEKTIYPYKDMFTPYLGYTRKRLKNNYTYRQGINGLQGFYDQNLSAIIDKHNRKNLSLNISFNLQKKLEREMSILKAKKHLQEAIAVIMNPYNYHIKAIASSNRYNANKILNKNRTDLEIHAILYLFKIGNFIKPIPKQDYKAFGLYNKSGIDLLYERIFNNKRIINNAKDFKVNFIQLLKMYAVFYNGGKIGKPTIAKTYAPNSLKQIISRKYANKTKTTLSRFFSKMKNKQFLIEKQDQNLTAHIIMKEVNIGNHKYLKAYFMIKK